MRARALLSFVGLSTLAIGSMAFAGSARRVAGVTVLALLSAAFSLVVACRGVDSRETHEPVLAWRDIERPVFSLACGVLALYVLARFAVSGAPPLFVGILLALGFVLTLRLSGLRGPGFWLLACVAFLGLPTLGSASLTDPWETHYGEVAREMLARRDWISTWWAHQSWFTSKPILSFWLQAASMALFGVHEGSGEVLAGLARPEWAVRLPSFLLSTLAIYLTYRGVAAHLGRRAGFFAGLVLLTSAQWILVQHQSITDVPFVACLVSSMGLVLIGLRYGDDETLRVRRVKLGSAVLSFDASLWVALLFTFAMLAQIYLLVSRHIELGTMPLSVHVHADRFTSGSAGNCGLPGQLGCRSFAPEKPWLSPALQAAGWLVALALLLPDLVRERRVRRVAFLAAWLFAGIATMGKGLAGFVLPMGALVALMVLDGRWRELLRLELVRGLLIVGCLVVPWYLATYARHGRLFFDDLVLRHMIGRTLEHLHDTNLGEDVGFRYYLWQLGYALFPWVGLIPVAFGTGVPTDPVRKLCWIWSTMAFSLFSIMLTKFHHYVMPVVPPLAILCGLWLAERKPSRSAMERALLFAGAVLLARVSLDLLIARKGDVVGGARFLHLFTYQYQRAWPVELDYRVPIALFALGALAVSLSKLQRFAPVVGVAFALWAGGPYLIATAKHWGQRSVLEVYETRRGESPSPLVAYQLNWKGENFYTGNRLALFVSTGRDFASYLERLRNENQRTLFVLLEHGRVRSLVSELGPTDSFEVVTDERTNNKFCLVKAVLSPPRELRARASDDP